MKKTGEHKGWGLLGWLLPLHLLWGFMGWLLWLTEQPPCSTGPWMSNPRCNDFMEGALFNNYMSLLLALAFFAVPAIITFLAIKAGRSGPPGVETDEGDACAGVTRQRRQRHAVPHASLSQREARSGEAKREKPTNTEAWEHAEKVIKLVERQNNENRKEREQLVNLLLNRPTRSTGHASTQRNEPPLYEADDDDYPIGSIRMDK